MKKLRFKLFIFLLAVTCLPIFIMLAVVIVYSERTDSMMHGNYILAVLTGSGLISAGVVVSNLLASFFTGKLERIFMNLKDVFSPDEFAALEKGSAKNAFNMIVNSFEYYKERRREDTRAKRELLILQGQKVGTLNILWRKTKDTEVFQFDVPAYWKKTYPGFDLPERANLFDYLRDETISHVKNVFFRAEESSGRDINIKCKLRVSASQGEAFDGSKPHEWVWVVVKGKSILLDDGEIITTGMIVDDSRYNRIDREINEYREMYGFALQWTEGVVYEVDIAADKITVFDIDKADSFSKMGYIFEEKPSYSEVRKQYWELVDPDYRERFLDRFFDYNHLILFPDKSMTYEYRIKNADGNYIWVNHTVCAVGIDDTQNVTKVIGRVVNMNEEERRKLRHANQGDFDGLTGAYRKAKLEDDFKQLFLDSTGVLPVASLVVADIDGFKLINDLHGREFGDKVILELAMAFWGNQLQSCVVARTGSDEFAMLVKDSDDGAAEEVAKKILEKFNNPIEIDGVAINITLSAGVAHYGSSGESFDEVFASAVNGVGRARELGMNKYVVAGREV